MDNNARKELKEAQKNIKDGRLFCLACSDPDVMRAVMSVFNTPEKDEYQLFQTAKLLDGMNELAFKATREKCEVEASAYLKAINDVTEIIADCL